MAFKPKNSPPDFQKLTPNLVNSKLQAENNPLYLVLQGMISAGQYALDTLSAKFDANGILDVSKQTKNILPLANGGTTNGIYIPQFTLENNISGVGVDECYWTRIGNFVTVTGVLYVTPTTAGLATSFGCSLPIISYFNINTQLSGVGIGNQLPETVSVFGDITNFRAQFVWVTTVTGTQFLLPFTFTYRILQQS